MSHSEKLPTKRIIDREEHQSRVEFAKMLEVIAAKLKNEGAFTLVENGKETVISPSDALKVEYSYEVKGDKHSFEIEFDWYTGEKEIGSFTIK